MDIEQFVMAYEIEQDRVRAMLPEGYESLRPVLRINTEIRGKERAYIEFNTPVAHDGKRGWLNIAHWEGPEDGVEFELDHEATTIKTSFFFLKYYYTGIEGGCPAERDNDGCFFPEEEPLFRPKEIIENNKEFCDCEFAWSFNDGDAAGRSLGKTLPAFAQETANIYPHKELTAENAAAILCRQVLGAYVVRFSREGNE